MPGHRDTIAWDVGIAAARLRFGSRDRCGLHTVCVAKKDSARGANSSTSPQRNYAQYPHSPRRLVIVKCNCGQCLEATPSTTGESSGAWAICVLGT